MKKSLFLLALIVLVVGLFGCESLIPAANVMPTASFSFAAPLWLCMRNTHTSNRKKKHGIPLLSQSRTTRVIPIRQLVSSILKRSNEVKREAVWSLGERPPRWWGVLKSAKVDVLCLPVQFSTFLRGE